MTSDEVNAFLAEERTCRVATRGGDGRPHVAPLWFVWDDSYLWLTSIVQSQRWVDLAKDPRVAIVVDAGHDYTELRGVEIEGTAEVVGDVPRTATPHEELTEVERAFGRKYRGTDTPAEPDGRHAWLRIRPEKITSWDFRKI